MSLQSRCTRGYSLRIGALALAFAMAFAIAHAQNGLPPFSGVWRLDVKQSKIEAKHPPIASVATIQYDGEVWKFSRTHRYLHKNPDTWTTSMIVGAKEYRIKREPPLTIKTRVDREGDVIVLREEYVADTGEKATNTVHYSLLNGGNSLVEDEQEVTSEGNERNVWILTRQTSHF
jgi:hypothetical protein